MGNVFEHVHSTKVCFILSEHSVLHNLYVYQAQTIEQLQLSHDQGTIYLLHDEKVQIICNFFFYFQMYVLKK